MPLRTWDPRPPPRRRRADAPRTLITPTLLNLLTMAETVAGPSAPARAHARAHVAARPRPRR
eukprot:CAMPEP_0204589492 /NCGR_PEP_ID=MMETSP0661-20131031/49233_1 /ASSEMBLY_ACC=CAM_ASM_000606 /TAXON_ID=109239 /ORGANISM="Alexandrium margalefi, Strain AMGDE01CS-322" /LENGTH=61 /DNA_ID=CAMNT_0051599415 /DNA_START=131 /DNA_END=313 /DNA_ORIENTATION=-